MTLLDWLGRKTTTQTNSPVAVLLCSWVDGFIHGVYVVIICSSTFPLFFARDRLCFVIVAFFGGIFTCPCSFGSSQQNERIRKKPYNTFVGYMHKSDCAETSGNVPSDLWAHWRFRSDCAFAQSDQNLHWRISDNQWCKVSSWGQQWLLSDCTIRRLIWVFVRRIVRRYFYSCYVSAYSFNN